MLQKAFEGWVKKAGGRRGVETLSCCCVDAAKLQENFLKKDSWGRY